MAETADRPTLPTHGAATLPSVTVDSYNLELEDADGFIGDKARRDAFREALDAWRKHHKSVSGEDPLGDSKTADISKKQLDELLASGSVEASGIVLSAIEDYAQALFTVLRRFLKHKKWAGTEAIVFGGGFRASRIGELAIGRAGALLKADGLAVDLELIEHHPDEAGLIGAAHLLPAWMLDGYDAILAVDVGGTNIRAGIVELRLGKAMDLSAARVAESHLWRHADEKVSRTETIEHLAELLQALIKSAKKEKLSLAPVVGIGCPGIIEADGSIARGAQNLPGNWESSRFNFPVAVTESIPQIGDHETMIVMHNDAVVQGLSHLPRAQKRKQWGILTIGTGLGNARYSTRAMAKRKGR
jgi:predicted NBD/HSP70 family sugar kinase